MKSKVRGELEKAYEGSKSHKFSIEEWKSEEWEGIKDASRYGKDTGIPVTNLK